jgi:tRNA(Ile)-lysidine synthase
MNGMSLELQGRIAVFLTSRLFPGARLCLGYSGGLDSSVLLHVLAGLRQVLGFHLSAVHVHHGLSPHADAWARHCWGKCAELGVPLSVHEVLVEKTGRGLEAAAREARYAVFRELEADFILLAHHLDDQVETFFLRLLRGAGVEGLAGMPAERGQGLGRPRLLRPLLGEERGTLQQYAEAQGLAYCEDDSNLDQTLDRNFLRHSCLPPLASRFPAYRRNVGRAAEHLRECGTLLADLAALDAERLVGPDGVDCRQLAGLSPARARNLLRHWLVGQGIGYPTEAQLQELLRQSLTARADAMLEVHLGSHLLRRHKGRLCVDSEVALPTQPAWRWQGEAWLDLGPVGSLNFELSRGEGLAAAMTQGGVAWVRLRAGGERLQPDCRRPRRALKKLLQEGGVPAWERARLPVLWIGEEVAWVAGVGVGCAYQAAAEEPGWIISWHPPRR